MVCTILGNGVVIMMTRRRDCCLPRIRDWVKQQPTGVDDGRQRYNKRLRRWWDKRRKCDMRQKCQHMGGGGITKGRRLRDDNNNKNEQSNCAWETEEDGCGSGNDQRRTVVVNSRDNEDCAVGSGCWVGG